MRRERNIVKIFLISVVLFLNTLSIAGMVNTPFISDVIDGGILKNIEDADTDLQQRGTRGIETHDWYMFHGNTAHTGAADPSVSAPDTNDTAWTFTTASDIEASAAVVGDMVYFANIYGNCDDDCMIYGINETTGNYWNFTDIDYGGDNSFRSSPAIADIQGYGNMLFIGSIGMGATPDFAYGLDANPDDNNDGVYDELDTDEGLDDLPDANYDLIWRSKLADYSSISSPLVAYIPSLDSHVVYVVGGQTLHALSAVNGDYIWNFTTGGYISTSPALGYNLLGNPVVYIASDDGFLYALDARGVGGSTTVKWQYDMGGWVDSSPTIADDRVFIGGWGDGILHCLDATPEDGNDEGVNDIPGVDYDVIWTFDIGDDYIYSTPAVHNGVVFITGYNSGYIYALEENVNQPSTSIIWSYNIGGGFGYSSPAIADGKVFVGSKDSHKVIALDEVGGGGTTTLIWEYETKGIVTASPAIANGKVYVGSEDNTFYVFGTSGYVNKKPYPPKLYSPLNTQVITSPSPRFDWSDAVDKDGYIESYIIEIDDDPYFNSPEYTQIDITETHYFPSFISDGTYFWHVRAKDNEGAYSIWSETWEFTIDTINDPPVVTVVSPKGGEVWAGTHDIYWYAYDYENDRMSFDLWLSDNSGASYDILLASGLTSHVREWRFETTVYPDGVNYRIKINVTDMYGLKSEDNSDADFEIDNGQGVIYDDWPQFHRNTNNTGYSPSQAPETNNTNWIFDTEREIDASPAIFGGMVFIGNHNGTFYALNETTGNVIWQYDHTDIWSWCDTSPAVGYVPQLNTYAAFFGLTISTGYNFFAMDIDGLSDGDDGISEGTLPANYNLNGDVLWAYKAESSGALSSSPTVFEESVYICFYETESGAQNSSLWAFDVNGYFDGDDWLPDDTLSPDFRYADVLWTFNTNSFAATSSPAVENVPGLGALVFVGTTEGYWPSELDPNLYALDANPFDDLVDQGLADPPGSFYDLIWETKLDDYLFSSPAVAYGNVYVGTYSSPQYNPDNSGSLYCLDAATGTIEWNYEVGADDDIYASPAVWNDMVFIPVRTYDRTLYAFDATPEDGIDEGYDDPIGADYDIIWAHNLYASKISSSPAVANGRVFIGAGWEYSWGDIYCLDAVGDGNGGTREIWKYTTPDFVYGSPSVANGCLFVTDTEGYVYKFGAMNGTDLTINHWDITLTPPTPQENGTEIIIQAIVTNLGNIDAVDVMVRVFDDLNDNGIMDLGEQIGTDEIIGLIPAYGEGTVSVTWTAQPIDYHNIYVIVDPLNSILEVKEHNNKAWTFFAVEPITYGVDYIIIRTEPRGGGELVGDKNYIIGEKDTFYCAGYNLSIGYVKDLEAVWESNDTDIAQVTSPGIATTFTASLINSGFVYVSATNGTITNVTGMLTVLPPDVDSIIIRDEANGQGLWVTNKFYGVGAEDYFYCAGYNLTSGNYVKDVESEWWSNNTLLGTVTSPAIVTTFKASDFNSGVLFVRATYQGAYTNASGPITVLQAGLDYIVIRNEPNGLGEEVGDRVYGIGESDTFYCAGYNLTAGYIQDVSADWESNNTNIATVTSPGIDTTFTASTSNWGVFKITATCTFLSNETGTITILPPSPDSIVIRTKSENGGSWVGDMIYGVGDSDTFYCAAYNITYGYIEDVSAYWTSSAPSIAWVTSPGIFTNFSVGNTSYGDVFVSAFYNSLSNRTGTLTILPPTVGYIVIRDEPDNGGDEVGDRVYGLGDSDTFYCAGYNVTAGYIQDVSADWESNNTNIATVTSPGISTTFNASTSNWGVFKITATYAFLTDATGKITILPPSPDSIVIRSKSGNKGSWVGDMIYGVDDSDKFYCAAYNVTYGYIEDVNANWVSSVPSIAWVTSPGIFTTFSAGSTSFGDVYVTAYYNSLSNRTGTLTILPPTVDYILIRDEPDNGGEEVGDRIYGVGDSDTFYCAGYNDTIGYTEDLDADWALTNFNVGDVTTPGISTDFTASSTSWGDTYLTATYDDLSDQTGELTVLKPTVDYIIIRDEPNGAGNEVGTKSYAVGGTDTFYCAGYNNTSDYIDDFLAEWTSSAPSIGHVTTYGHFTTFTASDENSGTLTVTAKYNQLEDTTGVLTVLAPKVDYAIIEDENGNDVEGTELDPFDSITIYCAGYNSTAGFIGNLEVIWESGNSSVADVTSPGSESTLTASENEPGQTLITATFQGSPIAFANIFVVDDIAPIADAGEDQIVNPGETVLLDASGSSDNIKIVSYTWSFEENGEPVTLSGKNTQYEFTKAGTYTITLTVTDSGGNIDTDEIIITVKEKIQTEETMWWLWILIVIIVIIVVLLLLFIMTKKKKKEEVLLPAQVPGPATMTPPTSAQTTSIAQKQLASVTVGCPSCKNNFKVQPAGTGLMTVTCPQCGASGQIRF
ncbi:MAG: PQQ-binding-like beta-propeller repeat protein [Thermoplasmata archaeon]|nr:MAG: PQQ-binding-like beta-propeller repeat protein [Thermoplasmata archaeon]